MKKYHRPVPAAPGSKNKWDLKEVGVDVIIADCLVELIEQGMSEDAHHWRGDWHKILDNDDLEKALNNPLTMANVMVNVWPDVIGLLHRCLSERREDREEPAQVKPKLTPCKVHKGFIEDCGCSND